jgi:hypothetical protein
MRQVPLMEDSRWFARLAEVPKVGYTGHPGVHRRSLPGHDVRPEIGSFNFEGKPDRFLHWPTAGGGGSQSPASAWCTFDHSRHTGANEILRRTYEALELPGTASDYHFALLHSYQTLWTRFRQQPQTLLDFERLCLTDIALVESRPDILQIGDDQEFWASVPAFYYLIQLYEREGYIEDALAIARRGAVLRQGDADVQRLEQRLASLREESAS